MTQEPVNLGPFTLLRPIGRGAMGEVWEATHRQQDVRLAVKFITSINADQTKSHAIFENEVRSVAKLHHPSICYIVDYGITTADCIKESEGRIASNTPYFAMEYADQGTLPSPGIFLPWQQIHTILVELLDALAHAHARNVIHRDLKPSNILIAKNKNGEKRLKITDFGISLAMGDNKPDGSNIAGTPRYMPPEQILGKQRCQGPWSDLYSLGCIAYGFAAGKTIFHEAGGAELLICHLERDFEPVEEEPYLPVGFNAWLKRILAKDISKRFQFAAEALWELEQLPEPSEERPNLTSFDILSTDPVDHRLEKHDLLSVMHNSIQISQIFSSSESTASTQHFKPLNIPGASLNDIATKPMLDTDLSEDIAQRLRRNTKLMPTLSALFEKANLFRYNDVPLPYNWRRNDSDNPPPQLIGAGLGLWGLRTIPIAGRFRERDVFYQKVIQVAKTGEPAFLFIHGPKGCGKTRLVEWMTQRCHELTAANILKAMHFSVQHQISGIARAILYHLGCHALCRHDALIRIKEFIDNHPLVTDVDDSLALLSLFNLPDAPDKSVTLLTNLSTEEKYQLFIRFFKRITTQKPCILWLEDIQHPSDALPFCDFLMTAQKNARLPILFVATYRQEDISDARAEHIKNILELPQNSEIRIKALTQDAHYELVKNCLPLEENLSRQVAERTDGNPLFAIQLIGNWVQRNALLPTSSGFILKNPDDARIPDNIHEMWLSRLQPVLEKCPDPAQAQIALEIASVLDLEFDSYEWFEVCKVENLSPPTALLNLLLSQRLFELRFQRLSFAHNLMRESLIRIATENNRLSYHHHCCADALMQQNLNKDYRLERIAYHFVNAGHFSEAKPFLLKAAEYRLSKMENEQALLQMELYEECLNKGSQDDDINDIAKGWLLTATIHTKTKHSDEAERLLNNIIGLNHFNLDPLVLIEAYRIMSTLQFKLNRTVKAIECIALAENKFSELDAGTQHNALALKSMLLSDKGLIYSTIHRIEDSIECYKTAIKIQEDLGDKIAVGRLYNLIGNAYQHSADYSKALEYLQEALKIFEELEYHTERGRILNDIGEIYRNGYRMLDTAENLYREASVIFKTTGALELSISEFNLIMIFIEKENYIDAKKLLLPILDATLHKQFGRIIDCNWLYAALLPCCAKTFDWQLLEHAVTQLALCLEDSHVVDKDILYCADNAYIYCIEYGMNILAEKCRVIASQQAEALEKSAPLQPKN